MNTQTIKNQITELKAERNRLRSFQNISAPLWQEVSADMVWQHQQRVQKDIDVVTEKINALFDLI